MASEEFELLLQIGIWGLCKPPDGPDGIITNESRYPVPTNHVETFVLSIRPCTDYSSFSEHNPDTSHFHLWFTAELVKKEDVEDDDHETYRMALFQACFLPIDGRKLALDATWRDISAPIACFSNGHDVALALKYQLCRVGNELSVRFQFIPDVIVTLRSCARYGSSDFNGCCYHVGCMCFSKDDDKGGDGDDAGILRDHFCKKHNYVFFELPPRVCAPASLQSAGRRRAKAGRKRHARR